MRIYRRAFPFLAALVVSGFVSLRLSAPAFAEETAKQTPSDRLLTEVRRILADAKSSEYQHKTAIDETAGKYFCDCSGLIDYALRRVAPAHLKTIEKHNPDKRPLAWDYVQTFQQAPANAAKPKGPWLRVEKVADARPGDVLAWQNAKKVEGDGQDTGHVMLIDEAPVLANKQPTDGSGKLYRVRIIDSTKSGHADDTRKPGQTGVGRGTIYILADSEGKPAGYCWKNPESKPRPNTISIGRPMAAE